jgi:CHASE2 domain-containing sensor protein
MMPQEARIQDVYNKVLASLLNKGKKKDAEAVALTFIRSFPSDEQARKNFVQQFGYEPTVPASTNR